MSAGRPLAMASRLVVAQAVVIAAMAITVVAVAALVGPAQFRHHMTMAGPADPEVLLHAEAAFRSAGLTAMAAGVLIAGALALAASALVTRRITSGLSALAAGAARVAEGDYATPVTVGRADRELAGVASGFNDMARRIADTEATRRRLLTDLAHELRTPLAAIDLLIEGIEDGVVAPGAATLATLRGQTDRIARLAQDVRQVSAAEEGRLGIQLEPVRVPELVTAVAQAALPMLVDRGITLRSVNPTPNVIVLGDVVRLGQVLDNLLRNAGQHTPAGGQVEVWSDAPAGLVRIGVRDSGEGISADDLPHVFERFYRGGSRRHDEGAGTGVGLAISRAIAVAHGGSLRATSDGEGRGAEFVLTLPVA